MSSQREAERVFRELAARAGAGWMPSTSGEVKPEKVGAAATADSKAHYMKRYPILMGAILLGLLSALSSAQAPVPFISQPLLPDATAPGGPSFTLTVNGTGFASNSVVQWNASARTTHFVSDSPRQILPHRAQLA